MAKARSDSELSDSVESLRSSTHCDSIYFQERIEEMIEQDPALESNIQAQAESLEESLIE